MVLLPLRRRLRPASSFPPPAGAIDNASNSGHAEGKGYFRAPWRSARASEERGASGETRQLLYIGGKGRVPSGPEGCWRASPARSRLEEARGPERRRAGLLQQREREFGSPFRAHPQLFSPPRRTLKGSLPLSQFGGRNERAKGDFPIVAVAFAIAIVVAAVATVVSRPRLHEKKRKKILRSRTREQRVSGELAGETRSAGYKFFFFRASFNM